MKLLVSAAVEVAPTATDSLIPTLPKKRVVVDRVVDSTGAGYWFDGRVLFINDVEVIEVPARCKAGNIVGAAGRMSRVARTGIPKRARRGKGLRISKVLVEVVEHANSKLKSKK